jgi:hypothetical protein
VAAHSEEAAVSAAARPAPEPETAATAQSDAPTSSFSSETPYRDESLPPSRLPAEPSPDLPPSAGKRGADMVRAALAEQQSTPSPGPPKVSQAVLAALPDLTSAPRLSKTLADVRAERRTGADPQLPTSPGEPVGEPQQSPPSSAPAAGHDAAVDAADSPAAAAGHDAAIEAPTPAEAAGAVATPSATAEPQGIAAMERAWSEGILESLSGRARSRFSAGRFLEGDDGAVVFGLPNPVHRDRCEEVREEVDQALAAHFGHPITLRLVVDTAEVEPDFFDSVPASASSGSGGASGAQDDDEVVDLDGLVDADDRAPSGIERVMAVFEGSTVVQDPSAVEGDDQR